MISLVQVLATAVFVHTLAESDTECDTIGMLQQYLPGTSFPDPQGAVLHAADVAKATVNECLFDAA